MVVSSVFYGELVKARVTDSELKCALNPFKSDY